MLLSGVSLGSLACGRVGYDATPTSFNVLGASDDTTSQFLDGALDEVRVTSIRRSASFIQTDARSESDQLIQFGSEEVF